MQTPTILKKTTICPECKSANVTQLRGKLHVCNECNHLFSLPSNNTKDIQYNAKENLGTRLCTASIIYFVVGAIVYLILAIICYVEGDGISGSAYLGSIVDVAFYSLIAYVVGKNFSISGRNNKGIVREINTANIIRENTEIELYEIKEQQKLIISLLEKIEKLEAEKNE